MPAAISAQPNAGESQAVSVTDLPLVSMLKSRLQWYETRQKVLASNVSNANTPGFQPKDLRDPVSSGSLRPVAVEQTSPLHLASADGIGGADTKGGLRFETRPSGNAVSVEDEMIKVAQNQSDYQLAASLYQKSLALLRTAVGKGA
jgi:flagellar basal-body rod protein FlgB